VWSGIEKKVIKMKMNETKRVIILSILLITGFGINAGYVASAQVDTEEFKMGVSAEPEGEWNEFEDAMWRERTPTIDEMMGAWGRAGKPDGFRIITVASEAIDSTGEPEQFGVIALTHDEYEQYGWFRPTTAQIDWAFRETRKILPKEQLKIWAQEHKDEVLREEAHEEELREELQEIRANYAVKGEIPLHQRAGGSSARYARRRAIEEELEHILAAESDPLAAESDPEIVYSVIDGNTIQLQNDERSIEACNKAIELNPNGADAYNYRGVAYADLKQHERAIEDFNKTMELNPKNADAYNNRGVAYCFLGHYERAIEDFNKAIELNPNFIMAYRNQELAMSKLEEKNSIPGFGAIFTIIGLLAVTHLLRRKV
jgi:PGF-CTERM protein